MRILISCLLLMAPFISKAQKNAYTGTLKKYQENYVETHEVVKEADRKYFRFFPINPKYRVTASFERINDSTGLTMKTSGKKNRKYFIYGVLRFTIDKKPLQLRVYQSEQLMQQEEYKDLLFVPFTDQTSGTKSYGGGRYLDFVMDDIKANTLIIDFNKAYNPYCAYTTGYNCPVPPRENDLPVAIKAGEMDFGKTH